MQHDVNMNVEKAPVFFVSQYVRYSVARWLHCTFSYLSRTKHNFMKEMRWIRSAV